ncbi:glycosyltransferase [Pseudokineococcus basanitobsidens]|uniref:Glycosyltransferase n=1 Tax=Pseudokineococcus basanitobsidens TaxID=1926649 RepID=A0ABU8RHP8_9ACTN
MASRDRREELLASLRRHEGPVVLVDNASSDGTVEAVRAELPHVDVLALPTNRGAAARTLGVERARTPYVAFADDDSWWAPGALGRVADLLDAAPRLALVNARVLVGPDERPDGISGVMARSALGTDDDLPGPSLLGFVACAAAVRRDAFLAAGGFDDVVVFPGEEERLAWDLAAAGRGLAYVDDLVVHHHPSPHRDAPSVRAAGIARSALLTAVMRRPWRVVARTALRTARTHPAALRAAVTSLPAALRARRPNPPAVEAGLRALAAAG